MNYTTLIKQESHPEVWGPYPDETTAREVAEAYVSDLTTVTVRPSLPEDVFTDCPY